MKRRLRILLASLIATAAPLPSWAQQVAPAAEGEPAITEEDRSHWSFLPPTRPALPKVASPEFELSNPIDHFILARLEKRGLSFAPEADRHTLIRRLSFDLTGLPPTPAEVRRFVGDHSPDAYDKLVDRLLASSAYGERWAQHWLDVARFAESDGFEFDSLRPDAWRYRDWVIDALNTDMPYDQFLQAQLAGDEIASNDPAGPIATGFLLAGPDMTDINLATERRHVVLNAMTATVGEAFLGLTLGCSQCHNHKTDPVSAADFYRLRAVFANTVVNPKKHQPLGPVVKEPGPKAPESYLMMRGDFRRKGPRVEPAFPRVLNTSGDTIAPPPADAKSTHRRAALARWMTKRDHPLTARVIVNRLWQHHFGRGIVASPNDFGKTGTPPSHPGLLDWLSSELSAQRWSMKHLHRLMVTSRTYRQASRGSGARWKSSMKIDPENIFLSRMPRRRLEGEAIRDFFLASAGLLNRKKGGPSVRPPLPREITSTLLKNQWEVTPDKAEHKRRSIYITVRRNLRYPIFEIFDRPDSDVSHGHRESSTTATQSLTMLNSEFSWDIAQGLAGRVSAKHNESRSQIKELHYLLFARPATEGELSRGESFLEAAAGETAPLLADYCLALLNTNEAIYVD